LRRSGAQGSRCRGAVTRCGCGPARGKQWSRAWRTSETIEEKAADEVRRHCELLVKNGGGLARTAAAGAALVRAGLGPHRGGGAVMVRRAGRRGGEAKAATRCDELGGATHDELPSSIWRSRQEQHSADLMRSARSAAVVGRP
jgi:hypothetical protein